jgi:hypothetical protein
MKGIRVPMQKSSKDAVEIYSTNKGTGKGTVSNDTNIVPVTGTPLADSTPVTGTIAALQGIINSLQTDSRASSGSTPSSSNMEGSFHALQGLIQKMNVSDTSGGDF